MFVGSLGVYVPESVSVEHAVREGWYPAEEAEKFQQIGAAVAGDMPAPEMARLAVVDAYDRWKAVVPTRPRPAALPVGVAPGPERLAAPALPADAPPRRDVPAFEIRSGCVGMISSLELAASYLQAVPERETAMVVSSDNHGTPLVDRWRMTPAR